MNFAEILTEACQEITSECIDCGKCVRNCLALQRMNDSTFVIASREPTLEEAYTCSFCGLCKEVCPFSLDLGKMFNLRRRKGIAQGEIDAAEYDYIFPDKEVNTMSLYRDIYEIDYQDLYINSPAPFAFFPGCTMFTFAPALTRATHRALEEACGKVTLLTDCCGVLLEQFGHRERASIAKNELKSKLEKLHVRVLVTACPNCFYELSNLLQGTEINVVSIYEALKEKLEQVVPIEEKIKVTIQDSCPDRSEGVFAKQVRTALQAKGYDLMEMKYALNKTKCCGSGGQVSHFQPELAKENMETRVDEAVETNADILVSYCLSCVLNFSICSHKIESKHALNLLLDVDEDYSGVKKKSRSLFTGPEGLENWEKLMANNKKGS